MRYFQGPYVPAYPGTLEPDVVWALVVEELAVLAVEAGLHSGAVLRQPAQVGAKYINQSIYLLLYHLFKLRHLYVNICNTFKNFMLKPHNTAN